MTDNGGTENGDEPTLDEDTHWQQVVQRYYEADRDGGLTTAIIFAIAEAKDVPPSELKSPILYDIVDVSAIEDAFFDTERNASRQGEGTVQFRYTDYRVTVRSDGWVQVYESNDAEPA